MYESNNKQPVKVLKSLIEEVLAPVPVQTYKKGGDLKVYHHRHNTNLAIIEEDDDILPSRE